MNEESNTIEFSARTSLVALGLRFQHLSLWSVVQDAPRVRIKQKVLQYTPLEKVLDCFINILFIRIQARQHPSERVVRWNAIGQLQKSLQPGLLGFAKGDNFYPAIRRAIASS